MKYAVLTVFAIFGATLCRAKTYNIPALVEALPPVSEIVTNVVISIDTQKLESFCMSMSFTSCASSELMLAIGHDADADGDLSFDEASLLWGCDCGEWYCADLQSGLVREGPCGQLVIAGRRFDPGWNLVKVVKRGHVEINEAVSLDERRKRFVLVIR